MRTLVLLAMRLTPKDLGRMARTTVILNYDGRSVRYEGVLLRDVLQLAGLGEQREPALASFVVAEATDGSGWCSRGTSGRRVRCVCW